MPATNVQIATTTKEIALRIKALRDECGDVRPAPKPKDKLTALRMLAKTEAEHEIFIAKKQREEEAAQKLREKAEKRAARESARSGQAPGKFDEKTFTILMDGSVQHAEILESFPTQARLLMRAWKKAGESTVTGKRLVQICDADGPKGVRSAKLIIQRYMTYFIRQGLAAKGGK